MDRYVLLDFCETVADFQTFDAFLSYVLNERRHWLYRIYKWKIVGTALDVLTSLMLHLKINVYFRKTYLVICTLGIDEKVLWQCGKNFYEQIVKKHLIKETLELIERFKRDDFKIIIISGGSKYYINYFAKEYGIRHVITAELIFHNSISLGILKDECLRDDKIVRLDRYMNNNGLSGIFMYAVTDSISDMPMIRRADKAIVVSHKKHKPWVDKNMEELIWG